MPELTLTEEQVAAYADAMDVEADDVTAETLAAYHAELAAKAKEEEEGERSFSDEDYEQVKKEAEEAKEEAASANRRFYEQDRDAVIDGAITGWKIDPAKRDEWQRRYDESPELTKTFIEELPEDAELKAVHGGDEPSGEEGDKQYADWAERSGVEAPAGGAE